MLRLQRLKIIQFRNVPPTELFFNDGFNILLGTNASGKTTLLKLIEACVRGDFSPYKEEEIEIEFDFLTDGILMSVKISNTEDTHHFNSPNKLEFFRDRIEIKFIKDKTFGETKNFDAQNNFIKNDLLYYHFPKSSTEDKLWLNHQNELNNLIEKYEANTSSIYSMAKKLRKAFYWLIVANSNSLRFDESLGFYEKLVNMNMNESPWFKDRQYKSYSENSSHILPTELAGFLFGQLISHFNDGKPVNDPLKISITETNSRQLNMIKKILNAVDILIEFKETQKKSFKQKTTATWMISDFYFKFGSTEESHRTLSYGQKRLFSFIYYAACNPYIIIADELVNGLHHAWIDACMDLIKDRQCFLTSQNPLLLDCLEFESAEQVQKTFIQCKRVESENEDVQMAWSNLKPEDAQIFYSAYQRGFQHISEILITRGLW